jgi:threonine synthase
VHLNSAGCSSAPAYSALSHLFCPRCGREHAADEVAGLCTCGSPLLVEYDLDAVKASTDPEVIGGRPPALWRYHELLPVRSIDHVVSLGEGMTPLLPLRRLGADFGLSRLLMKDDGLLPTGTFKARGAAVGVSRARELGVDGVAMATNGNAGAAWATYAARAGLRSFIVMPTDAPEITRLECALAGAEVELVRGHIGRCAEIVERVAAARPGYQDVSTLKEPYRIEGKKTIGFELIEQLGWRVPDVIIYPTGGGVGLIGIYRALQQLRELGWISGEMPRLVSVQAAGCAPIVHAVEQGAQVSEPWPEPHTIAFGITVPKPLGDFLVLEAIYATGGTALAVGDEQILAEQARCARREGLVICPEGAAALAAARRLRETEWLGPDEEILVLNTGAGLKYPEAFNNSPKAL